MEATIIRAARASGAEAGNMAVRRAAEVVVLESMQVGDMEAARSRGEIAGAVQAMGWVAATAAIMEVVQKMFDEGGEPVSTTLGVDLSELQVAIVGAAHAVVVDAQMALADQFGELQQRRSAVGTVHQPAAGWIWI